MTTNEYAVVDADGRYGASGAQVYHVGDRASCESFAGRASGVQVVQDATAEVGGRLVGMDVSRGAARYQAAVRDAVASAAHGKQVAREHAEAAASRRARGDA